MTQVHKHLIVKFNAYNEKHATWNNLSYEAALKEIVAELGMNILVQPIVVWCDTPGNRGFSGFTVIDTSHIAIHTWPNPELASGNPIRTELDVYSCKDFEVETIVNFIKRVWSATDIQYKFIDRTNDIITLEEGKVNG